MKSYLQQHSGVLKTEGVFMLILGVIAILLPVLTTFAITLLIGTLLLVGGILTAVRAIRFKGFPGATGSLIFGALSALTGIFLLVAPQTGGEAITIILAGLFLVQGIAEISASLGHRQWTAWGWMLISGLASLVLALLLLFSFPSSANWAIGLLLGLNLMFTGSWLLMLGFSVGNTSEPEPTL